MLTALHIHNFTLVDNLEIELEQGLSAITGETGTGKSLILGALAMALGDRADTSKIRQGTKKAEITAYFDLSTNPKVQQWLEEQDFTNTDSECLLRRSFTVDGRSRGSINGGSATMLQLRTLGEMLVDIHSQHEHQSLLRKETHRYLLDNFAKAQQLATEVEQHFLAWQSVAKKLITLEEQSSEIAARRDLLSFQVEELNQLGLQTGDLETIEKQHLLLSNVENLQQNSHQIIQLLSENEAGNIEQQLGSALHYLEDIAKLAPELESSTQLLNSALIDVQEAKLNIQSHLESFDANPEKLLELDEQLSNIHQLARKHRVTPEELLKKHQLLQQELDSIYSDSNNVDALMTERDNLAKAYEKSAKKLSSERIKAAKILSTAVNAQLQTLAMEGASLHIALTSNPQNHYSTHGLESVELLISTNPGQPHGKLSKIASGGELSRTSLAIQVVIAECCQTPTLIFDEVDVGIGGSTASVVGGLLRQLGEKGQVICVTHLPQVASCAHQQLVAQKNVSDNQAESSLKLLNEEQRTDEIARMLGAGKLSAQAVSHAREMLSMAKDCT